MQAVVKDVHDEWYGCMVYIDVKEGPWYYCYRFVDRVLSYSHYCAYRKGQLLFIKEN